MFTQRAEIFPESGGDLFSTGRRGLVNVSQQAMLELETKFILLYLSVLTVFSH